MPAIISNLDVLRYHEMPANEQQSIKLASMDTTNIKTLEDLTKRVFEYIHVASLNIEPVSLAVLNRRFNKIATKLGTNTMGVCQILLQNDKIEMRDGAKTFLGSKAVADQQREYADSEEEYKENRERFWSNGK